MSPTSPILSTRGPQVEAGVRQRTSSTSCSSGVTWLNLAMYLARFSITCCFVVPGRDAGRLHRRAHRAAVVGAVQQEFLDDLRVAGDEARAHARHVGALGQAGEHDQARIIGAAELVCRFQRAERRFRLEVDLGVALVAAITKP